MRNNAATAPSFEKVIASSDECLALEEVSGRELCCIYHYHPEYELTYIVAGYGSVLIGSAVEPFNPGHLALIGCNIPHHYASMASEKEEVFAMSRVIKFRGDVLGRDFFALREMAPIKQMLEQSLSGVVFSPGTGKKFHKKIAALFQSASPRRVVLFLDLLCGLASAKKHMMMAAPHPLPPKDIDTEHINSGLAYINRHLCEKVTLARVSHAAGLSPMVFSRVFSRVVRKNFSQYVLELRLDRACRLLTETARSISEIGYESGFSNLSNFNRLFRKNRGMTPREYRCRIRNTVGDRRRFDGP